MNHREVEHTRLLLAGKLLQMMRDVFGETAVFSTTFDELVRLTGAEEMTVA